MTKLHNKLSETVPFYRAWHQVPHISVVHFFILAVVSTFIANAMVIQLSVSPESLTATAINAGNAPVNITSKFLGSASDHILVKFKTNVGQTRKAAIMSEKKLKSKSKINAINVDILSIDPGDTPDEVVQDLITNPKYKNDIQFAEVDAILVPTAVPNDPYFSSEWNKTIVNLPAAWDTTTGSPNVVVGIADTGVDCTHPDLSASCVPGWNFYDNNSNTADVYGHGTAVAGVVAAIGNNGIGVAGSSWNAKIMPLRVTSTTGSAFASDVANAITYAADHGVQVVNNSMGGFGAAVSTIDSAAQYLWSKGGILVRSEGNSGADTGATYNDPDDIMVPGTDGSNNLYSWSSYGLDADVAAPGCSADTTANGGGYRSFCGTSNSSPEVAGLLALMYSVSPNATPQTIRDTLYSTALDLGTPGWDKYYGWGRIDAAKAVQALAQNTPPQAGAPVVTISASPTSGTVNIINPALTWSATNSPTSCSASGDWSGTEPTSGNSVSQGVLTVVKTYTYTLKCSNANGSDTKSTSVSVAAAPLPPGTSVTYRYVKFHVTTTKSEPTAGCTQLSEFTLLSGGSPVSWPAGSITSNPGGTNNSGEGPGNTVDTSLTDKLCDTTAINGTPMTLVVDTGSSVTFDGYKYGTANDFTGRDPVSWTVEGSNDGVNWTVLDTRTNETITDSRNVYTSNYPVGSGQTSSDTTAPSVPQNVTASAPSGTQANVTWNASTDNVGVAGYNLYRNGTKIWNGTNLSYTDNSLQAQTTYSYTVSAYDAAGNTSAQSTAAIVVTPAVVVADTTAPSVPQNVSATAFSSTQINVSWNDSTDNVGVTGYNVNRNGVKLGTVLTAGYVDTAVSPGTTYTYTVSAYDAAGNTSAQSTSTSATTPAAPLSITSFSVTAKTATTGTITWTTNQTSSGSVAYGTNQTNLTGSVAGTSGTTHTATISGLNKNTTYYYQITATSPSGSVQSTISSFKTKPH